MRSLFRLPFRKKHARPSHWPAEWFSGGFSGSGELVTPDRAMREATVAACVRILAESVAQLPMKVFQGEGADALEHGPLVDLLRYPNAWQDSFQFREYMMVCLCLRGNFYALMTRDRNGDARELLPLHPESVSARLRDWEPVYAYTDSQGRSAECGPDTMLHVRGESLDGIVGFSPIAYHRNTIGLSLATEAHGGRIFKNGARPGGILTHPAKLSDEALEHLRQSWAASHGGENAGGTAILEEGMDFKPVAMSNEDAQYLETRKFQRGLICGIFRVPPHMVADLEKATFSNIEHQSIEFAKYSILPWAVRIETALMRHLLSREQREQGLRIRLVLDGLERADIKTRYESYSIAIQNGILSANECRRLENRPPRAGGDVFLQPLNMTDGTKGAEPRQEARSGGLRTLATPPGRFAATPLWEGGLFTPRSGAFQGPLLEGAVGEADWGSHAMEAYREGGDDCRLATPPGRFAATPAFSRGHRASPHALGKAKEGGLNSAAEEDDDDEDDEPEHDDWADGEWSSESADLNQIMRDFRPKLEKMYREIVAKEVAEIRKLVDKHFPEGEKRRNKSAETEFLDALQLFYGQLKPNLEHTCQPLYADLSGIVAAMAARQVGVDELKLFEQLQGTVRDYVSIEARRHVTASIGQLRKLIRNEEDVRAAISKRIAEWEAKRGKKLSDAAAVYGPNWYAREAYKRAGVRKIRWVANGGKTCSFCGRLSGAVTKIDENFVNKNERMPGGSGKPGYVIKRGKKQPPVHRGCVCAIVPVVDAVVPEKLRGSVAECSKAADLFAAGEAEQAQEIGGKALEELLNAAGLLGEKYKFNGVGFAPPENGDMSVGRRGIGKIDLRAGLSPNRVGVVDSLGWMNKYEWRPAQGVLNALKKIHEGRYLAFMDEFSLYALCHEIQHTNQVFEGVDWEKFTGAPKNLMEVVNDWTARRNYDKLLKILGRDSITYGDMMKRNRYGYGDWIANFDALLNRLKIKDDELLDKLTRINETVRKDLFIGPVASHLEGMARAKKVQMPKRSIESILKNLNVRNFKEWIE